MSRFAFPLGAFVLTAAALATNASAQVAVGSTLPNFELKDFAQTKATSVADFTGRAVLYEFFAFW